eukprot:snap_masked-scaffold_49-processed-gene-1.77-mRNA-1 protein AED:1.00 eAED:1.00 QI:0/0/0/0/1/1/2/0/317
MEERSESDQKDPLVGELEVQDIHNKEKYLGVCAIACIVVIWTVSSFVIQSTEDSAKFTPFGLSLLYTSLFSVYSISFLLRSWKKPDHPLQILKVSLGFFPLWFFANLLYNYSVCSTSVGASTLLSGTSPFLIFAFERILKFPEGSLSLYKGLGLSLSFIGTLLVSLDSSSSKQTSNTCSKENQLDGDLLALSSAVFYALYSIYIKLFINENAVSAMFGIVGLLSLVIFLLLWFVDPFLISHHDQFWKQPGISLVFVNGFFNNVVADFLWAKSVLWTSASFTSLGLSLTMPFGLLFDWLLNSIPLRGFFVTIGFWLFA